jgi:hypothetical protein
MAVDWLQGEDAPGARDAIIGVYDAIRVAAEAETDDAVARILGALMLVELICSNRSEADNDETSQWLVGRLEACIVRCAVHLGLVERMDG